MKPLNILYASAEVAPVAKIGGLADVAGSLPQAIMKLGHDIRLVMPAYAIINRDEYNITKIAEFSLDFMGVLHQVGINQIKLDGNVILYLIENQKYYDRPAVYGEPDDLERFVFFSKAIIELPSFIGWQPDILHAQDWHAAVSVPLLKKARLENSAWSSCASIFTIHNLAYQGRFDDLFASNTGISQLLPPSDHPLHSNTYSTMALAIWHADSVSTVSPTYAKEILTTEYGENLDPILRMRSKDLYGILNGIDYQQYNPATDPYIAVNYDVTSLEHRVKNKLNLQERSGFEIGDTIPLVGMVGRLATQKGTDIVAQALMPLLDNTNIQFIFLGVGEEKLERPLEQVAMRYPKRVKLIFSFDADLAQLIYAGSDMFLMPSLFEPCGLGQLIALRYGAIPIVRRTGGLADTVQDVSPDLSKGNGFVFDEYRPEALIRTVTRAVKAFQQKTAWRQLILRGMSADYSWNASAEKYQELYIRVKNQLANTRSSMD